MKIYIITLFALAISLDAASIARVTRNTDNSQQIEPYTMGFKRDVNEQYQSNSIDVFEDIPQTSNSNTADSRDDIVFPIEDLDEKIKTKVEVQDKGMQQEITPIIEDDSQNITGSGQIIPLLFTNVDDDNDAEVLPTDDDIQNKTTILTVVENGFKAGVNATSFSTNSLRSFVRKHPGIAWFFIGVITGFLILFIILVIRECCKTRNEKLSRRRLTDINESFYNTTACSSYKFERITLPNNEETSIPLMSPETTNTN